MAAFAGRVDAVRVLVALGADMYACSRGGLSPMHVAAAKGREEVVRSYSTQMCSAIIAFNQASLSRGACN